jgi:hypothetical protein
MDCLPQGDFRPAETHRDPSGDQLQHKLAGVTTIVRQVIGKLDADTPLFLSSPAFQVEARLSESGSGTSTTSVPW